MAERKERRPRAAADEEQPQAQGPVREAEAVASTSGTADARTPAPAAAGASSASGPPGVVPVLVELHVPQAELGASAAGMAAGLPGSFEVDPTYAPVEITSQGPGMKTVPEGQTVVTIRGRVSEAQLADLRANPKVLDVWPDSSIAPFQGDPEESWRRIVRVVPAAGFGNCPIGQCNCAPSVAGGDIADVATRLGVDQIWDAGFRGNGVVVGIVDGGITAKGRATDAQLLDRVTDGWPAADWGTRAEWGGHGNMSATDALGMAPESKVYDIRIASSSIGGVISDALAGFQWAIDRHRSDGTPHILSNSWGIFQEAWEPRYARDSNHPFTRKVVDALEEGIVVLFAAGNCGGTCPDQRCGEDSGPGRSIWGANGHPRVITVGAVDLDDQFVGYSSEGPAALDDPESPQKPDFCSITHFRGFFPSDSGTSAATPVAAGVVALLKQAKSSLSQDEVRTLLRETASDIGPSGWDQHSGAGILQAKAAFDRIKDTGDERGPGEGEEPGESPWEQIEELLAEAIALVQAQVPSSERGAQEQRTAVPSRSGPGAR